ncbi:hypothetical protein [Mycobacterium sp. SMC-14]|uniref:DUF7715 family protein n=1 Tax=Mycobacterium sp. SMC-14 TaxID=3385968 RepID=UPI00390CAC9C
MADLTLTRDELITAMHMSLVDGGWPAEWAAAVIDDNLAIASTYPAGTVIERKFDEYRARTA